uniref:Lysine transporter LysE n=2 Tax=Thermofilum pendens TaxID=2269 RepID=A0A7J3X7Z4_THEPE
MLPAALAAEIVGVTASGAFSPGPLTLSVLASSGRSGARYGALAALGHMLAELPLYFLLGLGLLRFLSDSVLRALSTVGGAALLLYAVLSVRASLSKSSLPQRLEVVRNPVLLGFSLTALNPYFLAWWMTAGLKLIADILAYSSTLGVLTTAYLMHVWMDFLWLSLVAWLAKEGSLRAPTAARYLQFALALVLVYYGVCFLREGLT